MPRVNFSLENLRKERAAYDTKRRQAGRRLLIWQDDEPTHAQRDVVFAHGKLRLFRYKRRENGRATPLLMVYALVNRPYMADLLPDCSLIGDLLDRGLDIYLIDWGYPDSDDRFRSLEDHVNGDLDACVEHIRAVHGCEAIDLLGICQGGTLSLCYATLFGEKIRTLITTVTPVDFKTATDLLSHLVKQVDVDALVAAYGNIPGEFLNAVFLAQKPLQLMHQKYVDFVHNAHDPVATNLFLAMEKWIFDSPALAGAFFRDFVGGCYQRNDLVKGALRITSRLVDLKHLKMPILNIFARDDHLVPPAASRALARLVGSEDYTEVELPGGHIGVYVSAKARRQFALSVADWLDQRGDPASARTVTQKKIAEES